MRHRPRVKADEGTERRAFLGYRRHEWSLPFMGVAGKRYVVESATTRPERTTAP